MVTHTLTQTYTDIQYILAYSKYPKHVLSGKAILNLKKQPSSNERETERERDICMHGLLWTRRRYRMLADDRTANTL